MKSLALQYYTICPTVRDLKTLCDNRCEVRAVGVGKAIAWMFSDEGTIAIDVFNNVIVDGVIK